MRHERDFETEAEAAIWSILDLDETTQHMETAIAVGIDSQQMGTGHTHNACYMCSNSATTHGCGTCG